jgi:hypothetical protein
LLLQSFKKERKIKVMKHKNEREFNKRETSKSKRMKQEKTEEGDE